MDRRSMIKNIIRVEKVGPGEMNLYAGSQLLLRNLYSRPGGLGRGDDELAKEGMLMHFWGVDLLSKN